MDGGVPVHHPYICRWTDLRLNSSEYEVMACLSSASMATRRWRVRSFANPSVIVRALALGVTYATLSALIVVVTAFGDTSGATFWPGAGLTLAVLLHRPRHEWPYYLVAVAIAETCVDLWGGYGVTVALGLALANTIEPLVAAFLLRRGGAPEPDFGKRADLARFIAVRRSSSARSSARSSGRRSACCSRATRGCRGSRAGTSAMRSACSSSRRRCSSCGSRGCGRMSREALPSLAILALVTAARWGRGSSPPPPGCRSSSCRC